MKIREQWLHIDTCEKEFYQHHTQDIHDTLVNRIGMICKAYDLSEDDDWHIHLGFSPSCHMHIASITCGADLVDIVYLGGE